MIHLDRCPVCKNATFRKRTHTAFGPEEKIQLSSLTLNGAVMTIYDQCIRCGVFFQNPRMEDLEVTEFYHSGIYRASLNLSEDRMDLDEQARAEFDAGLLLRYGLKPESHLDIGCSRGYFLREVDADWQYGVDANPLWSEPRLKLLEVKSRVDDIDKDDFDLVSMIHVLEHVVDPMMFLSRAIKKLHHSGALMVEVPSDESPGGWARLPHLFHFEPWVLERMLNHLGMAVSYMGLHPHLIIIAKKQ